MAIPHPLHPGHLQYFPFRVFEIHAHDVAGPVLQNLGQWQGLHSDIHWRVCRSALEIARRWLGGAIPPEVLHTLASSADLANFEANVGVAEYIATFDNLGTGIGRGANLDLLLIGAVQKTKTVVGVEGKESEPFGDLLGSRSDPRISHLARALFSAGCSIQELRFQLLSNVAGTLAEAKRRGAARAVFLVHEFCCAGTPSARNNQADLDRFVAALSGQPSASVGAGHLVGPFRVPGNQWIPEDVDLWIGKARLSAN